MSQNTSLQLHRGWLLGYIGFVIYGSLVPLDFHPHTMEWAWQRFQQAPMLKLGIESRADWIANGVLYVPVGFLLAERFIGKLRGAMLGIATILAIAFCALLACGIEFAQLFFPPRTVSQNDIFAEIVGAMVGTALALPLSSGLRRVASFRPTDGKAAITRMLVAYMAAYLAYSLFPFDFLLGASELSARLASDKWGWLFAGDHKDGVGARLIWLGIEAGMAMPFGIFVTRLDSPQPSLPFARLIAAGLLLGLGIESAQFFLYNGVSQGASIAARVAGVLAGGFLLARAKHLRARHLREALRRYAVPLGLVYLVGVAAAVGWFHRSWGRGDEALAAFQNLRFVPFYYHYFVSEAHAIASLISVAMMFLPLGILAWAWNRSGTLPVVAATALAFVLETSKLFFSGTHADPTNILIAATTAWAVAHLLGRLDAPASAPGRPIPPQGVPSVSDALWAPAHANRPAAGEPASHRGILWLVAIAILCSIWLAGFPVKPLFLGAVFIASGLAVWFAPVSAMAIVPAALPVFDLAPWSGRFYLDEFDVLLAVTMSVGYVRTRGNKLADDSPSAKLLNAAVVLLGVSFLISTIRALLPWHSPDINSFATYFSQFNALRITKGLFWALVFVGFAGRIRLTSTQVLYWFSWGMALGLAATVGVIAREKLLFGGLLSFSTDYRATGPFSAIHTGGAYIECYLAVATPFLILLIVRTGSWIQRLAGVALLLASTYGLMATVSRNGFPAYAVACSIGLIATLAGESGKTKRIATAAVLAAAMLTVAIPIFKGGFAQQRMSQVGHDLNIRTAHWRDGLAMRDDEMMTELFGMGVGRYPETHYWRSREKSHASAHGLGVDGENVFLRIVPGNTLYVEQIVEIEPKHQYRLSLDLRSPTKGATAGIALCEKSLLTSSQCATWQSTSKISQPGQWQHFEQTINSAELGQGAWLTKRPIKLSFYTNWNGTIDIDNIRLTTSSGSGILSNGDFSDGMDHWYFATDEHLAWHMKSMPLAILFDQGWFGLLAFGSIFAVVLHRAVRATWSGDVVSGTLLAAICGFLVVAIFDTLIDAPRFLFLLVTLALFAGLRTNRHSLHGM